MLPKRWFVPVWNSCSVSRHANDWIAMTPKVLRQALYVESLCRDRLGPRLDHPLQERDSPRPGIGIVRWRQPPRPALRRMLDDPGHFNRGSLCRLLRAIAGAGGDDGHSEVTMYGLGRSSATELGRAKRC
jgi:hypothetical protein